MSAAFGTLVVGCRKACFRACVFPSCVFVPFAVMRCLLFWCLSPFVRVACCVLPCTPTVEIFLHIHLCRFVLLVWRGIAFLQSQLASHPPALGRTLSLSQRFPSQPFAVMNGPVLEAVAGHVTPFGCDLGWCNDQQTGERGHGQSVTFTGAPQGAHHALCPGCAKRRLFWTTGGHLLSSGT